MKKALYFFLILLITINMSTAFASSPDQVVDALVNTPSGSSQTVSYQGVVTIDHTLSIIGDVTIQNTTFQRDPSFSGTMFDITSTGSLTLENCIVDAGAEWSLNQSRVDEMKNAGVDSSMFSNGADITSTAMQYCNVSSGSNISTDRLIKVSGNLVLNSTTIKNYVGGAQGLGVILVTNGNVEVNGDSEFSKIFAFRNGGDDMGGIIRVDSGNVILNDNTKIIDNACIGANGSLIGIVGGKVTINNANISNNVAVNSNGMLQTSEYGGTAPELIMNGGVISDNISIPGVQNNFGSMIYNRSSNASFTMNGGKIINNIGGFWPALNMRYSTNVNLNQGIISGNEALAGTRDNEIHLRGGAVIGQNMYIEGNIDAYGGSSPVINNGTIIGNIYVRPDAGPEFINNNYIEGEIEAPVDRMNNNGIILLPEIISITGDRAIGNTLTASFTGITECSDEMKIVWLRDGEEVGQGNTYVLTAEDVNGTLSCYAVSQNGYYLTEIELWKAVPTVTETIKPQETNHPVVQQHDELPPVSGDFDSPLFWLVLMLVSLLSLLLYSKHSYHRAK